jgi:hypothetical protein
VSKFYYKAVDGKEYKCKIINKYDKFVDIQIISNTDDSFFVKVPTSKPSSGYKPSAYVVKYDS